MSLEAQTPHPPGGGPLPSLTPAQWAALPERDRTRFAVAAASAHDPDALAALTEAYLTLHARTGAGNVHTRRAYATSVRILLAAWRHQDLLHPAPGSGAAWLRTLETSGAWRKDGLIGPASPSTLRVRLAGARTLYHALRWAGATTANPFDGAHTAPETTAPWDKRHPYVPEQLAQLLAAASPQDTVMLLLGADAGLSVSEMCALRWSDLDLVARTLVVQCGKGGKSRVVTLSDSLADAVRGLTRDTELLLPLTDSALRKRMRVLCARAGVPYLGLHALRHTAGTRLMREGATAADAARHLGHASVATVQVYARWSGE